MTDVLIRGAGLLGTSLGLALSQTGARTYLEDLDAQAVRTAVAMGAGSAQTCPAPDVVFIAVPPEQIADEVAEALMAYPEATVSDVSSVKSEPIAALLALGVDLSRYVGGHPMAGREVSGAAGGRGDLFEDRPWILTPISATAPSRLEQVAALAEDMHAVVRLMDPDEHDRAVALCSHAPQVVASLLAAQLLGASAADVSVAGPGVRDTTRIAASDPGLWAQILWPTPSTSRSTSSGSDRMWPHSRQRWRLVTRPGCVSCSGVALRVVGGYRVSTVVRRRTSQRFRW